MGVSGENSSECPGTGEGFLEEAAHERSLNATQGFAFTDAGSPNHFSKFHPFCLIFVFLAFLVLEFFTKRGPPAMFICNFPSHIPGLDVAIRHPFIPHVLSLGAVAWRGHSLGTRGALRPALTQGAGLC